MGQQLSSPIPKPLSENALDFPTSARLEDYEVCAAPVAENKKGNDITISVGIVWCYIHGYLNILSSGPSIEDRLRHLVAPPYSSAVAYGCVVLLCPSSGRLPTSEDLFTRLKVVGTAEPVLANIAGARGRSYGEHVVVELVEQRTIRTILMAVEPVNSLRTLRLVAEAMASEASSLSMNLPIVIAEVVGLLKQAIEDSRELSRRFKVVEYDTDEEAAAKLRELLMIEAHSGRLRSLILPSKTSLPLSAGAYMAWSFFMGYLEHTSKKRHAPSKLAEICDSPSGHAEGIIIPVKKVIIVCPLHLPRVRDASSNYDRLLTFDDVTLALPGLTPAYDVKGVTSDVPGLSQGRTFGAFSLYHLPGVASGECFALEMATPLRTLAAGICGEILEPSAAEDAYHQQADNFVVEMRKLMLKKPDVAEQYVIVAFDESTSLEQTLRRMAENSS